MSTATEPAPSATKSTTKPAKKTAKKTPAKKVKALLLTLGGAPTEWHTIAGVGYVHPTIPSPVGDEGECSLERAKELAADDGCEVKLVEISQAKAKEARKAREGARSGGIKAAREVRKDKKNATAAEAEQVAIEAAAAAGNKE